MIFSHSFSRLKYEVSKHEQLQKIINLWPIWEREWGCQLSEMYAFSIWHFLMPASFSHRTVKLPFLLALIERPPPPPTSTHTIMYCSSIIVCWDPVWLSFPLTLREHFILFVCSLTWAWCTRPSWPFKSWEPFKNSLLYHIVLLSALALWRASKLRSFVIGKTIYHWHLIYLIDMLHKQCSEWHRAAIHKGPKWLHFSPVICIFGTLRTETNSSTANVSESILS